MKTCNRYTTDVIAIVKVLLVGQQVLGVLLHLFPLVVPLYAVVTHMKCLAMWSLAAYQ